MRDARVSPTGTRSIAPIVLLGLLFSWLVVQNGALLVLWSWPAVPALLTVARALLKVAAIVAVQLAPAALVAAGVAMLWVAARRTTPADVRRLQEVRHG
ncbi:MAG: hypothetical protein ACRENJ_01335 [Candidatus Eiseniibacteriota bacterium]